MGDLALRNWMEISRIWVQVLKLAVSLVQLGLAFCTCLLRPPLLVLASCCGNVSHPLLIPELTARRRWEQAEQVGCRHQIF